MKKQMLNFRVYLSCSHTGGVEDDVYVDIKLPAVPRVGNRVFLSESTIDSITDKIAANSRLKKFYSHQHIEDTEIVDDVVFTEDADYITITLKS